MTVRKISDKGNLQGSLEINVSHCPGQEFWKRTHLVTVTPEEVLGADVLVRVLDALLEWWEVLPVLPMLIPQVIGVETAKGKDGDDDAARCQ